jgi:hypothetical protein
LAIQYAAIIPVWVGALIAGIITGAGFKAGVEPSPEGIALLVLETFCEASEDMPNSTPEVCWTLYGVAVLVSIIVFLISVFVAIQSIGHWIVGIIVYLVGFIPGIMLVLA